MASQGNLNQPGGSPFDVHKLFRPSTPPLPPAASASASNLNSLTITNSNPTLISAPFPLPSASYPPPTGAGEGGGGPPFTYLPQTSSFHHHPQFPHQHHPVYNLPSNPQDFANVHNQRSIPYPTPALQPQVPATTSPRHQNFQNALNSQNPNNHGARLMALLSAPTSTLETPQQPAMSMLQTHPTSSLGSEFSVPQNVNILPSAVVSHQGPVIRMTSSKLPKGRHLDGEHLVYDIDVRLQGEVQPQLEVTPITKYGSDPGLVLGRQIAVNKTYICYGLKLGAIRVLNINTALRSLLKGLAQRVTDMAFFAEDVHLLASASVDGRVYIWKITEGPDEDDKQQITGRVVIAIQITGEAESFHPRVCWHCHKQEVLVVGIGRQVLKIDTTKVGKGEKFSAEEPLKCSFDKLIDGVQLVGSHDGEVTGLSMCQWMTTRLVSASADGTIKIWEDRKLLPIAVLRPHGGQPVNSVTFLAAPERPDHIVLITGGPLNREIKIWVSASEEGWLLPTDAESWHCNQTLELRSSEAQLEEAFFNQVVALSQAGLILLANAKRNAIYAVHMGYGPNPASTLMDYIAEFTVTLRILSFTATSESLPHGEQIVQVYCVQTQAIQQYALDLSQCLPPPMGNVVYEKSDSNVSRDASCMDGLSSLESSGIKPTEESIFSSGPKASTDESGLENAPTMRYPVNPVSAESSILQEFSCSNMESRPISSSMLTNDNDVFSVTSSSLPLSPRLSRTRSDMRSPSSNSEHGPHVNDGGGESKIVEYSVDRQMDSIQSNLSTVSSVDDDSKSYDKKVSQDDTSMALNQPVKFIHPTHLVTPSEILMANSTSEVIHTTDAKSEVEINILDLVTSNETRNVEVDVKVTGQTKFSPNNDSGSQEELQTFVSENKENYFCSQASDLGIEMARECRALSPETYVMEEPRKFDGTGGSETVAQPSTAEENHDMAKDATRIVIDSSTLMPAQQPASNSKGKKQKGKNAQGSGPSSPSLSAFNSTESSNEPGISYNTPGKSQILSMQILNQLVTSQKEMQRQMSAIVAVPVNKEGKRLEAALGRNLEKTVKANADALWARFQEENAKQEKLTRERMQQVTNMINSCLIKDLPATVEKTVKKELAAVGQSVARTIIPTIEKTISTSIAESFQKGVGDKAVNQLEKSVNSKLEAAVARQIQAQFQTSGKQVLQETLKSTMEASMIPAFDMSCRALFEQVDATFQKGMVEHTAAAQQQFEASHSSLALTLRDAINSASSISQTLSNELLDGQRKLVALAVAGPNANPANPLINQLSNGPLGGLHEKLEVPLDPTKELSRLIAERKYEEAFTTALHRSDVTIVSWLCSQVDLPAILTMTPLPLSQGVLLSLLQQLACDISNETPRKLTWMREVLSAINPTDAVIVVHVRPIFEQVYQILNHQRNNPTTTSVELSTIRLIMHALNSMLLTSK